MSTNPKIDQPFLKSSEVSLEEFQEIHNRARSFSCPCCGNKIQFTIRTSVIGVAALNQQSPVSSATAPPVPPKFSDREQSIIDQAKEFGVLQNFIDALSKTRNQPKDAEKFFLTFLKLAERKDYPQFGLRMALPKHDAGGKLEAWVYQEITLITADGYFKQFIPTKLVKGETLETLEASGGIRTKQVNLDTWVKTGCGYVVGKGMLFREIRANRSAGSFAKASS